MIGDHHGRSAGRATLLVRAVDIIPLALGWGMLIFLIDRAIVTEPQA
jgi:hypothetical protein